MQKEGYCIGVVLQIERTREKMDSQEKFTSRGVVYQE
jgi:hypothetical protein